MWLSCGITSNRMMTSLCVWQHLSSLRHLDSVQTSSRGSTSVASTCSNQSRLTLLERFLLDVLQHHPHHYNDPRWVNQTHKPTHEWRCLPAWYLLWLLACMFTHWFTCLHILFPLDHPTQTFHQSLHPQCRGRSLMNFVSLMTVGL